MFDDIPRPTCRSFYTVSDKHLRHGGSGYETTLKRMSNYKFTSLGAQALYYSTGCITSPVRENKPYFGDVIHPHRG